MGQKELKQATVYNTAPLRCGKRVVSNIYQVTFAEFSLYILSVYNLKTSVLVN